MQNLRKSTVWYIKNHNTQSVNYLNVGEFKIGRMSSKKLDVQVDSKFCSKLHCTLEYRLHEDRVFLHNNSNYGTYVNGLRVDEMELDNGDNISLVNDSFLPADERDHVKKLVYELNRSEGDDMAKYYDMSQVNNMVRGEILVQVHTEPIIIDDSDTEESSMQVDGLHQQKQPVNMENTVEGRSVSFDDDYEIGEPSNIPRPPTPPTPKKTDPVSQRMVEKEKEREAIKIRIKRIRDEEYQCQMTGSYDTPTSSDAPSATASSLEPPLSKKPRRVAQIAKDHTPYNRPLTPTSKSPSVERSPNHGIGQTSTSHSSAFPLDGILTPASISPCEEIEIDPIDQIVSTMINWNAEKIMDPQFRVQPYHKNLVSVPAKSFGSHDYYKKVQSNLVKCHLWHRLNKKLNELKLHAEFHINDIKKLSTHGNTSRLLYECQTKHNLLLSDGEIIIIKSTINTGRDQSTFIGYVSNVQRKNGLFYFSAEVALAQKDAFNRKSPLCIIAHFNIMEYIEQYKIITNARECPLFESIVDPFKSRNLFSGISKCRFGLDGGKTLDRSQKVVFTNIYNTTIDALCNTSSNKGFVGVVTGFPGSGKSKVLLEMIISLMTSKYLKSKKSPVKILVTGLSRSVDFLTTRLRKFRDNDQCIDAETIQSLKYIHYASGKFDSDWENQMKTTNIVFAPIHSVHKLKRYCNKFDVVLFDDANETDEALSTMMLQFSPSSVILFGDPSKKAIDSLGIERKYPRCNLNQSMFERLRSAGRCVLHIDSQYRFAENLSRFLKKCLFDERAAIGCRKAIPSKPIDGVSVYHRNNDGFCLKFIKNMLEYIDPKLYSFGIIYPPNIKCDTLMDIVGVHQPNVMLSTNSGGQYYEKDVIVLWVNESARNHPRWQIDELQFAFTHAKHALFVIGSTKMIRFDANWNKVLQYAAQNGVSFDLNDPHTNAKPFYP